MIDNEPQPYSLLVSSPTVWYTSDSDEHQYADQEIYQGDPPAKEKHIQYISKCDKMT